MGRRAITRVALSLVAVAPVLLGITQILHFTLFFAGFDMESVKIFRITAISAPILIFTLIISIYEHFCIFHRITICATIYASCSYYFAALFPSVFAYNISNLIAVLTILAGIVGCAWHFILQINDFFKYVAIKSREE